MRSVKPERGSVNLRKRVMKGNNCGLFHVGFFSERELSQLAAGGRTSDGWNDFDAGGLAACCGLGQTALRGKV
jgi:hypothetical protein